MPHPQNTPMQLLAFTEPSKRQFCMATVLVPSSLVWPMKPPAWLLLQLIVADMCTISMTTVDGGFTKPTRPEVCMPPLTVPTTCRLRKVEFFT